MMAVHPKPVVVIIDDNEDFGSQYGMLAEMAGYTVEVIRDGRKAIERLDREPVPTLVLLDVLLPLVNGEEILEAARKKEKWAEVPIYFLTADVRVSRGYRDYLPGAPRADGVIEKGADSIKQVRELLSKYKRE
jgi:CheY-like chemotaxis protein